MEHPQMTVLVSRLKSTSLSFWNPDSREEPFDMNELHELFMQRGKHMAAEDVEPAWNWAVSTHGVTMEMRWYLHE